MVTLELVVPLVLGGPSSPKLRTENLSTIFSYPWSGRLRTIKVRAAVDIGSGWHGNRLPQNRTMLRVQYHKCCSYQNCRCLSGSSSISELSRHHSFELSAHGSGLKLTSRGLQCQSSSAGCLLWSVFSVADTSRVGCIVTRLVRVAFPPAIR
jgi:hypothetical protein